VFPVAFMVLGKGGVLGSTSGVSVSIVTIQSFLVTGLSPKLDSPSARSSIPRLSE